VGSRSTVERSVFPRHFFPSLQRYLGFLDGGDRAGVVHTPVSSLGSPSPVLGNRLPSESEALPGLSVLPTSTLLLANLPSLLFGCEDDLRGLVCPFGRVKTLRIVTLPTSSPSSTASPVCSFTNFTSTPAPITATTAAIVQYVNLPSAQDARRSLDGESYAGCTVRVAYLMEPEAEPASPESPLPETPTFPAHLSFPPPFLSAPFSRCTLPMHKAEFDGRDVGNHAVTYTRSGRQWEAPQQQFYTSSPFPPFETYPGYGGNSLPGGRLVRSSFRPAIYY
jgi:hypothetical protein